MAELKARLRADLAAAMKHKNTTTVAALRLALSAIGAEEVAGKTAKELSDDEVRRVLTKEVKKRKEAAQAFTDAGRTEQAATERAEADALSGYLPAQLSDAELHALVEEAVAEVAGQLGDPPGPRQMGEVMKAANGRVAGRAEGGRVASVVKAKLAEG
ncbi:MAG: GatB/YqeY domain-containing protein [Pseudonocardiaceae bacterium]|nr:GatB/YqeY domain-containing protein [Pseudonocardiaceae bacterium]